MRIFRRARGNGPGARTLQVDPNIRIETTPVDLPYGTTVPESVLDEARQTLEDGRAFAPHCDPRILHQDGECWACDLYPDWQKLRKLWGIAFTGHRPDARRGELECPADYNRPPDSRSDHRQWGPNQAQGDRP